MVDTMIDHEERGDLVHMHGNAVLMVRVLMTGVGVHVLERRRP